MRKFRLLQVFLLPVMAGGCAASGGQVQQATQPPPGAVVAGPAYPPIGATWKVRVTDKSLFHATVADRDVTATAVTFNGRAGYGLASPAVGTTKVLDPATFNPIGTIQGGRVAVAETPDAARFSWPLWVGKSWAATNSYSDNVYGAAWGPARSEAHVSAMEDVTVPAGTFRAFRIDYLGGIGSSLPGGFRNPGTPGFETRETYWYTPGPKLIVKSETVRPGENYQWAGTTTTELLSPPG